MKVEQVIIDGFTKYGNVYEFSMYETMDSHKNSQVAICYVQEKIENIVEISFKFSFNGFQEYKFSMDHLKFINCVESRPIIFGNNEFIKIPYIFDVPLNLCYLTKITVVLKNNICHPMIHFQLNIETDENVISKSNEKKLLFKTSQFIKIDCSYDNSFNVFIDSFFVNHRGKAIFWRYTRDDKFVNDISTNVYTDKFFCNIYDMRESSYYRYVTKYTDNIMATDENDNIYYYNLMNFDYKFVDPDIYNDHMTKTGERMIDNSRKIIVEGDRAFDYAEVLLIYYEYV